MTAIPVSGLMLFCGCVLGCAGLLRECAWTGALGIGRWAAADCSCEIRGSCQVVVFSRWLRTHNKSKHICRCDAMTTRWWGNVRHILPQTCSTCATSARSFNEPNALSLDRCVSWRAMCAPEWNWLKSCRLQNSLEHIPSPCNWLVGAPASCALFTVSLYF